jgi:hypothetical protein
MRWSTENDVCEIIGGALRSHELIGWVDALHVEHDTWKNA